MSKPKFRPAPTPEPAPAPQGHNSRPRIADADQLRGYIERIEKLKDKQSDIGHDISAIFAEAKGKGFDVKVMRQIIQLRKLDQSEREERAATLDTYKRALGMQPDLFDQPEAGEGELS